jgi:Family of unknown function (DUF6101)
MISNSRKLQSQSGERAMVESTVARRAGEELLVQRDWRADGGARRVRVTRSDILIARRFGGVDMRIRVPVPAYRGVFLDLAEGADGAPCYRLLLAHADRDLDVLLEETPDAAVAAADASDWADWLGLPLLAAAQEEAAAERTGAQKGPVARRGGSTVARRRPRLLTRRRAGETARMATIFAGEREIVSYD